MIVSIASGKGGTGKTTVAASLAHVWEKPLIAADFDVEEPNLHLFMKPRFAQTEKAYMDVPAVDTSKCTYCRACADLCQFKAISVLGEIILIFPEMCHGCAGCISICPEGALSTGRRELGEISWGKSGRHDFIMGRLRVGEAMSPPLMRQVKSRLALLNQENARDVIIDAPPGVSCPAVNAVMDSDVIILVTEPTPFGRYDLQLAHKAFLPLDKPMGVVVNRDGIGDDGIYAFCRKRRLPVLARIPFQRRVAESYAKGHVIAQDHPRIAAIFSELSKNIVSLSSMQRESAHA